MKALLARYSSHTSSNPFSPFPFAILSRGYRSKRSKKDLPLLFHTALKEREMQLPSPLECGDEPYMLARKLSPIWFGIGQNRCESAQALIEKGARCFLLDDGLQHRKLKRDCDLVLLDAEKPFANGHLFPRGALRESPTGLSRASAIVLYPVKSKEQFERSCQTIAPYTKAPIIGMKAEVTELFTLSGEKVSWLELEGSPVAILCGIARPERFRQSVQGQGLAIVAENILADHGSVLPSQLTCFAEHAASLGARAILCTEKDAVKWGHPDLPKLPTLPIPLLYFRLELCPSFGRKHWDALVDSIYSSIPF